MKNKNIIITNSNLPNEFGSGTFTSLNSDNITELIGKNEKIKSIYIDEHTLSEHPEIFSVIRTLTAPPKIIIDNIKNITDKLLKHITYKDTEKIPLEIERIISDFLNSCMIKNNHSGYFYLTHALFILFLDITAIYNVKKNIYLPVEVRFQTAEESVERCIKYAVKQGFIKSKRENCNNIFKNFTTLPSNKVFLETSSIYLQNRFPDFIFFDK